LHSANPANPPCAVTASSVRASWNPNTVCRPILAPCRYMVVLGHTPVISATSTADTVFFCLPPTSYLCSRVVGDPCSHRKDIPIMAQLL
jgi:hypothetical protein